MVKKQDLETALNGADIQALETLRKEALKALKLEEKRVRNLETELEEKTGLEAELIAEQLEYLKENSFEEWNKIVYKRCSARIAELK